MEAILKPGLAGTNTVPRRDETPVSPVERREQKELIAKSTRMATGATLGLGALLGMAFSGGANNGFEKIGKTAETISNIISVPFTLFFPFITLKNEFSNLKGESKTGDDQILNRMVYSCASLGFAGQTFAEPILAFTRNTLSKVATVANLPHILFTLFSYTGGRFMGALTTFKRYLCKDDTQKYRLEQQFNSLYKLGNLGSAQCSVNAMSDNFCVGWETIGDLVKGDFSSAFERFKGQPISVGLGTLLNSWIFPFEWAAKFFDTSIRCAENTDNFRNAIGGSPAGNWILGKLDSYKKFWAENSNKGGFLGKFLYLGREFAKAESLIGPPIGMVTVVLPAFNKFLNGNFFNKEAQELEGGVGRTIALFDKVCNTTAFFGHIFYTGLYGLSIRLPQAITTTSFYITSLINKVRGVKYEEGVNNGYIDPLDIREKVFNRPWINKISQWAETKLQGIEAELHGESASKIDPDTKESKYIRGFARVMAEEVCYEPIREKYAAKLVEENGGKKPDNWKEVFGKYLQDHKEEIIKELEPTFDQYLKTSVQFTPEQITYMKSDKGKADYEKIMSIAKGLLDNEINSLLHPKPKTHITNNVEMPKTFIGLLTNPKALLEVLKLRTFHLSNSVLPLFIRGFINVVDFGKRDEEFWYRNFKAQETGIREGDYMQATDREACPVFLLNFQNAGKGAAKLYKGFRSMLGMAA